MKRLIAKNGYRSISFSFFVDEVQMGGFDIQRLGYGHAMMQHFVRWCRSHNIQSFYGTVMHTNYRAQSIYLDVGMKLYDMGHGGSDPHLYICWPAIPEQWQYYKVPTHFSEVTRRYLEYDT